MSLSLRAFGQNLPEYSVPVLNERAVRAGAGILFLLGIIAFMNAWLVGNFSPTRVFIVAFLIDFTIRLFINPEFAPSLMLGQWCVRKQQPEWVGARQKRFAWAIGYVLALAMLYLIVIKGVVGPINLIICGLCLSLMFFETAFGICIGCWVYLKFKPEQAILCPGGVCEYKPDENNRLEVLHALILSGFIVLMVVIAPWLAQSKQHATADAMTSVPNQQNQTEADRCKVPDFAKAMGHEEKWKLHNNCK